MSNKPKKVFGSVHAFFTNKQHQELFGVVPNLEYLKTFENKDRLCFCLRNAFSNDECSDMIKISEEKGYIPALVNTGGGKQKSLPGIRNSSRCIIDDFSMSAEIYRRISHIIPQEVDGMKCVGVNERLRFLRYDPGEFFRAHYDGQYETEKEVSQITVQVYLNEGYRGGETTFRSHLDSSLISKLLPKTGTILIFEHQLLHQSLNMVTGRKYTIRSDIMYTKKVIA